ncbi:MAG: hypothetical protein ACC661_10380 [Verrucomicrobiales bacterium]
MPSPTRHALPGALPLLLVALATLALSGCLVQRTVTDSGGYRVSKKTTIASPFTSAEKRIEKARAREAKKAARGY